MFQKHIWAVRYKFRLYSTWHPISEGVSIQICSSATQQQRVSRPERLLSP